MAVLISLSFSLKCYSILMILILFPLHRPLCFSGRLGERKRKRAGKDGKGKKRSLFPLPIVPLALAFFFFFWLFLLGYLAGISRRRESHYPDFPRCYLSKWSMQELFANICTLKPHFTDTRLIGHIIMADCLLCPWEKKPVTFSLNSTRLIRTPRLFRNIPWPPQCPY